MSPARDLSAERAIVTGGSRGVGLAIVQALLARGAEVTVLARDRERLAQVSALGAKVVAGDATDAALMDGLVERERPSILVLDAGATPHMGTIEEQSFDSFSVTWNTDVKATLHGIQAALKVPMPRGGRVLLVSSGAALVLSVPQIRPEAMNLSGGYIGAKRVIWLMAHNANAAASKRQLGLHFQVILPMQLMAETDLGRSVASAYATAEGTTVEAHVLARYGKPLAPAQVGEDVALLLTDASYASGVAYGVRRDAPLVSLDGEIAARSQGAPR